MTSKDSTGRRIVLGVTSSLSLRLMQGFPEFLVSRGWDVHIVASGDLPDSTRGITYHHVSMRRDPHPWHDLQGLWTWCKLLRRLRPDVVSTGTPKAGLLGMLAARLTRQPVRVYKLRGLRLETSTGLKQRVLGTIERLTMACSQSIISVSPSLRQQVLDLKLASGDKVVVLGSGSSNGVDLDRFDATGGSRGVSRRALGISDQLPVVGFVGRLGTDKGIPELLDAALELKHRGHAFVLLLAGPNEDASCDQAVARAGAEGLTIVRRGFVEDPVEIFHALDVLCLPTRREGFPNVVLEAAASAIPVVTTDATGAIDSVIHEKTGLLARTGDATSIADAVERLLVAPELREIYGAHARRHVKHHFQQEDVWLREAELYESLSGKRL